MIDSRPLLDRQPIRFNDNVASKEYLGGGNFFFNQLNGLAYDADPLSLKSILFGENVVEKMLRDPELKKCITVIKTNVLVDGMSFYPALSKPPAPKEPAPDETPLQKKKRLKLDDDIKRYEKSKGYSDFLNRSLKRLEKPILTTLESMLDALFYGNKIAEKVFSNVYDPVLKKEVLIPTSFRVKKRDSVSFVVNRHSKVVGIQGIGYVGKERKLIVLPTEKFLIFTFGERDEDPRGTSMFEACYNSWYLKTLVFPEYLKWLQQCALPSIIAIMPPLSERKALVDANGTPLEDSEGNTIFKDESLLMLESLLQMKNSSVMVAPNESKFQIINSAVSGDPFKGMLDVLNKEMEMAMLLQTLATSDSKHNTRSASEVHISVMDAWVYRIKSMLADVMLEQYARQSLSLNFTDFDEELMPKISLGLSTPRDWNEDAKSAAALFSSGYLSESQLVGLDQVLQLTDRAEPSRGSLKDLISAKSAEGNLDHDAPVGDTPAPPEPAKNAPGNTVGK